MGVIIKSQEDKNFVKNYVTSNILDCISFWNREGESIIAKNKSGEYGDAETKKQAETMQADDFILHGLLLDCKVFCKSDFAKQSGDKYECGRTRSHVWVHINDERVLMIYSENN